MNQTEQSSEIKTALAIAIEQNNKKNAYKHAVTHSLKESLMLKNKTQLQAVCKALRLEGVSGKTKAGLSEVICGTLTDKKMLQAILNEMNGDEFALFEKIADTSVMTFEIRKLTPYYALQALGLCAVFLDGERLQAVVSDEIKPVWEQLKQEGYPKQKTGMELVHRYARAAVNLYGAIGIPALAAVIKKYDGSEWEEEFIRGALLSHIGRDPDYYLWNSYAVHEIFGQDLENLEGLLAKAADKPRYLPETAEDFLKYGSPTYYEDTPVNRALAAFLFDYTGDWSLANMLTGNIRAMLADGSTDDDCVLMLKTCMIELEDNESQWHCYTLLKNMRFSTRLWAERGHTAEEATHLSVPERNELCPCGSGLKYKKCCSGK